MSRKNFPWERFISDLRKPIIKSINPHDIYLSVRVLDYLAEQATYPSTTPAEQKTNFDKRSEEMRVALNAVTAILNAVTDGASGADSLGMTAISALGAS